MNVITREVLAKKIATKMAHTRRYARETVDCFFEDLSGAILDNSNSGKILFSSFGVFKRKRKSARIGRNPQTDEAITLPAQMVITFSATGNMRRAVNGGPSGRIPSAEQLYPGTIKDEIEAKRAARIILGAIKTGLINGDRVEIRGFGSFSVRDYGAYMGRNPKTGEIVGVAPKKRPFFKPSKMLLRRANL
jgi:integration host factor subunit beta